MSSPQVVDATERMTLAHASTRLDDCFEDDMLSYIMNSLARRISDLEGRLPVEEPPGRRISLDELNPAVAAMWLAVDLDLNRLTLAQLEILRVELKRFTV